MPFGIKSAQEVFQKTIYQNFHDLPGVETDIDDILIWSTNEQEHRERLEACLQRCKEINLTLNKEKCAFGQSEVKYIGHILSAEGMKPDKSKLEAISKMPAPVDKKGIERLLGCVNYLAKFIPNLSSITDPIRTVLRKDIEFHWSKPQVDAFERIKKRLTEAPVLQYYNSDKPITVSCDASQFGLGAVLLQEGHPIAYASRSLTGAETRYAQIEKELLAVLFSLERFNQYTYGQEVLVESDHKPLESIVKKPLIAAPPRLQRMLLRLQKYTFTLKYCPGHQMYIADTLSRAVVETPDNCTTLEKEIEEYVHTLIANLPASDVKLEEIKQATKEDSNMGSLKIMILEGWPEKKDKVPEEIREFWTCRDELSEIDDILFRGERIIIPKSMRRDMLERIHSTHMGIEKSKQRARDVLYWPNMSTQIEDMVTKCPTCAELRSSNQREPMIPSQVPDNPWQRLATDLFEWSGSNYLVIVDYYSRYFEIAKLNNTKSSTIIHHTKSIFARHGIPIEIRSDNGPQFSSHEFKEFAEQWGFKHTTSSPYYPQSNGLAEKAVQTIKRLLEKAKMDNKDPYLAILEYRNTPIDYLASPAQMLMSRRLRSTIPTTTGQLQPSVVNQKLLRNKLVEKNMEQKKQTTDEAKEK